MSLARLWRSQGNVNQARELLAPVYGWFTLRRGQAGADTYQPASADQGRERREGRTNR